MSQTDSTNRPQFSTVTAPRLSVAPHQFQTFSLVPSLAKTSPSKYMICTCIDISLFFILNPWFNNGSFFLFQGSNPQKRENKTLVYTTYLHKKGRCHQFSESQTREETSLTRTTTLFRINENSNTFFKKRKWGKRKQ